MAALKDGVIRRGKSWSYVIRVTDASGASRPRWVGGFPSEDAAKAARDAARVAARRGEFVDRSAITVEAYLSQWLSGHSLEVKPKTLEDYRSLIARYVVPRIGRVKLQAVRPSTLTGLYQTLLAEGGQSGRPLSARTVGYVHAVLRKAFNDAVRTDQLLPSNPADRAKRPRATVAPGVREVWDATQLVTFLDLVAAHRLLPFFRLAAFTGARRGELLHLRWEDVRLDGSEPSVFIRGSVAVVAGRRVEGTTKSGRTRTVSIDDGTVAILRAHAELQGKERERAGGSWRGSDHVFRMEIGSPLHADAPGSTMRDAVNAHNRRHPDAPLPPMRLHDLRHVHATLLLRAGVPVHVVAARLGHADPAITLRVYAHVLPQQASEVAQVFASMVDQSGDETSTVSNSVSKGLPRP
ncbi:MAG: tyrosine-type recombinase/integrase [Actinomycetota bacterium]|nr:tyrosine-type recombinase/integrase [Actinomycetota bacterium]